MKPLPLLLALVCAGSVALVGCDRGAPAEAEAVAANTTASLAIEGMTCASCAVTVKTALKKLGGIASVDVDVEGGSATVRFDAAQVSAPQIAAAITDAGYTTTVRAEGG